MLDVLQRIKLYKQLNPNELSESQFQKLVYDIRHPEKDTITDEYLDFKLWCLGLPSRQVSFAKFIAKKLSKFKGAKILEVGCGRTARLSRLLSEEGFKMTCVDPKLEIASSENVKCIKDKFNYAKFDLSEYDFVIAQEPCDATEHIVRACIAQDVPFLIALCGTPHKLISGEMPKDIYKWYDYLVNISSDKIRQRYIELDVLSRTPILKSNNF